VYTPAVFAGQAAESPMGGAMPGMPHGSMAGMQHTHTGTLDLNSAPVEELRQLPGISEVAAKKIVENRPYARADELITKKILSKPAYDTVKDHITVTKPTK
jgi:DNA uptake protein ComE-like DNA-binding protein